MSDKCLLSFSKGKEQHSFEQLKQNLVQLISETQHLTEPSAKREKNKGGEDLIEQNPQLLVGKQVAHYFKEDGTCKGYPGLLTGLEFVRKNIAKCHIRYFQAFNLIERWLP